MELKECCPLVKRGGVVKQQSRTLYCSRRMLGKRPTRDNRPRNIPCQTDMKPDPRAAKLRGSVSFFVKFQRNSHITPASLVAVS